MSAKARPIVRGLGQTPGNPVPNARGATMEVLLGPEEGAPNFVMRRFTLEPGARIPEHRHDTIEHEQMVLEGEMVLGLDGQEVTVRAGDSILIPAGTAHCYENRSRGPVRFLCVVPRSDDYRTEWLEGPAG